MKFPMQGLYVWRCSCYLFLPNTCWHLVLLSSSAAKGNARLTMFIVGVETDWVIVAACQTILYNFPLNANFHKHAVRSFTVKLGPS
jgi:hypothetical protein